MKLTGINGSPRGKSGNSAVFLKAFLDGYAETKGHTAEYNAKEKSFLQPDWGK